jgi:hypothetical protein
MAEAAMASVVLGLIMLAVATAISTAQQVSFEGQKRLLSALVADDLMIEIATRDYDDLSGLDGLEQEIGSMATLDGVSYPDAYWALGRRVGVEPHTMTDEATGASVPGRLVRVAAFDQFTELAVCELFVPEPSE